MIRDLNLRRLRDARLVSRPLAALLPLALVVPLALMVLAGCSSSNSSGVSSTGKTSGGSSSGGGSSGGGSSGGGSSGGGSPTVSSIELSPTNPSIAKGTSTQLTATAIFSNNSQTNVSTDLTWTSASPSVATVSSSGKVSAVGTGTAKITGTCKLSSACGTVSANLTVTVTPATLVSIAITPASPSIPFAATEQFVATGTYTDNSTQTLTSTVTWTSSNTSVATFSNASNSQGLAAGLQAGSSSISATLGAVSSPDVTLTVTARVESVLWSFGGTDTDGQYPVAALIQGTDGNFYGTTLNGGANTHGTVFQITPDGVEKILYSFPGFDGDGQNPNGGLIQGSDGNFYGTTFYGGTDNEGTVFKITPAGVETVLYSFNQLNGDGRNPSGALVLGTDGNFYGTTKGGGANFLGAVFSITPAGDETLLYSFAGVSDGNGPQAGLIQGADGNFYGTTVYGGLPNHGTVFKITPGGVETVLHSFAGSSDGANPDAGLIQGTDGNFYGTTVFGGAHGYGTAFEITPAGVETVLYSFAGGSDGKTSVAGLIQGADGNFYGTTEQGGANSDGTIFRITPAGVETVLYSFAGSSDGSAPNAGLIQDADGNFYGITGAGGADNAGTVFKF